MSGFFVLDLGAERGNGYHIVLQGRLDLIVNGYQVTAEPFQLVGVRANVPHQVIGGQAPIMSVLIRVPGEKADKTLSLDSGRALSGGLANAQEVVQIDLRQPHIVAISSSKRPHTLVTKADINVPLVHRLAAAQFTHWAHLPISPVERDGWGNTTFRLGDDVFARLAGGNLFSILNKWLRIWIGNTD